MGEKEEDDGIEETLPCIQTTCLSNKIKHKPHVYKIAFDRIISERGGAYLL